MQKLLILCLEEWHQYFSAHTPPCGDALRQGPGWLVALCSPGAAPSLGLRAQLAYLAILRIM